ncbi:hypothetical protein MKEN_00635100 [Mycena kentingensis (nom. inval.)]|nr:hypothetical protein MKEN_00635100 [Mycena kentingensis (nom. inval.)]
MTAPPSLTDILSRALSESQEKTAQLRRRLADETASLKKALATAQDRERSMKDDWEAKKAEIQAIEVRATELVSKAKTEVQQAHKERDVAIHACADIQATLDACTKDTEAAQDALCQALREQNTLKQTVEKLTNELKQQTDTLDFMDAVVKQAKESLLQNAAKISDLSQQLAKAKAEVETGRAAETKPDINELQFSALSSRNAGLEAENRQLRALLDAKQTVAAISKTKIKCEEGVDVDLKRHYPSPAPTPSSSEAASPSLGGKETESRAHHDASHKNCSSIPVGDPYSSPAAQQRAACLNFMAGLPSPSPLPPRGPQLQPIHRMSSTQSPLQAHRWNSDKYGSYLFAPGRTLWCSPERRLHALVFAPTMQIDKDLDWVPHVTMLERVGKEEELFVVEEGMMYYVGTYRVHSMRELVPPGSLLPVDVTTGSIARAMRLETAIAAPKRKDKLREAYPDGQFRVECFGLEFVGFNWGLYNELRERFVADDQRPGRAGEGAQPRTSVRSKSLVAAEPMRSASPSVNRSQSVAGRGASKRKASDRVDDAEPDRHPKRPQLKVSGNR